MLNDYVKLKRFKEYFDDLYGQGLEIANWHQNGSLELFDNFYESAIEYSEEKQNYYVGVLVSREDGEVTEPNNPNYERIKLGEKLDFK